MGSSPCALGGAPELDDSPEGICDLGKTLGQRQNRYRAPVGNQRSKLAGVPRCTEPLVLPVVDEIKPSGRNAVGEHLTELTRSELGVARSERVGQTPDRRQFESVTHCASGGRRGTD